MSRSPRIQAADPDQQARRMAAMFGRIAGWYDFLNRALSLGLDVYWRRRLVNLAGPPTRTGRFLDLAAGTLDVSKALLSRWPGSRVAALDISLPMLVRGRGKLSADETARTQLGLADGRSLPLADASVDAATIAFGIRNITPREAAFAELARVVAPGGRLCVLEFGSGRTRIWRGIYNLYLNRILPLVGRLISGDEGAYRYLADTIRSFPDAAELGQEMRAAGFEDVYWLPLCSGIVYIHVARKGR